MSDLTLPRAPAPVSASPFEERAAFIFAAALSLLPVLAVISAFALSTVPAAIGITAWAAVAISRKAVPPVDKKTAAMVLAIMALSFASVLWAVAPHEAASRSVKTVPLMIGFALIVSSGRVLPPAGLRRGLRVLPYAVIAGFLLMDIECGFNLPIYRLLNGMTMSDYLHPAVENRAMICLTLFWFPALAAAWLGETGRRRAIVIAALAVSALPALVLTESQSTQVAALGGMLCFAIVPLRFSWVWKALSLCVVVYAVSFPWLAIQAYRYQDVVNASPYFGEKAAYGGERMEVWHGVAEKVMEHPWLGHGTEATRTMHFDFRKFFKAGTILHPHNLPLQVWMEFGIVGITLACLMLARIMRDICTGMDGMARRCALPVFMMCLFIGSVTYGMWQGWWIGMLMALAAAFTALGRAERERAPAFKSNL